jgi:hypothetical protein
MKWIFVIIAASLLNGCGDNKEEQAEKERKEKLEKMYKVPPPSDRSKDKWS